MQCIPIRDLKNTSEISAMCKQSNAPIFITKNGYNDMVIMSAEVYERIRLYTIYEKMMEAEADQITGQKEPEPETEGEENDVRRDEATE